MFKEDISERVWEYIQSERYKKHAQIMLADINTAMENVKATDEATQIKGAKRLSYLSRCELGMGSLVLREWFCDEINRVELADMCCIESNSKVLSKLFSTLKFIHSRYIVHPMWEDYFFTLEKTKEDESNYIQWVLPIVEECHQASVSIDVQIEIAGIFAICRDSRAWDIFNEILPKKSAYCSWATLTFAKYAKYSITERQKIDMTRTLEKILEKVKNPSVQRCALEIKTTIAAV